MKRKRAARAIVQQPGAQSYARFLADSRALHAARSSRADAFYFAFLDESITVKLVS